MHSYLGDLDWKFDCVLNLLKFAPVLCSVKGKGFKLSGKKSQEKLFDKFVGDRKRVLNFAPPQTLPDPIIPELLKARFGIDGMQAMEIVKAHYGCMIAENNVGALLERYLAHVLEPLGWIWCSGNFVKNVDFMKLNDGFPFLLQIKNRDNSENSVTSSIRNGTQIQKWFRSFSKPNKKRLSNFNWNQFPDLQARNYLSEQGFEDFVGEYVGSLKVAVS